MSSSSAPNLDTRRVVFSHAVEALLVRALKGRLTDKALIAKLRETGIDLEKPFLPAYPFDIWVRGLEIIADHLYPGQTRTHAFYSLGKQLATSYQETLIGKALFAALRVLSARRVIDRMARNFRTSNNFTEVVVTEIGPGIVDLTFNVVESDPAFTQGILSAGLPLAGLKDCSVAVQERQGESATYRILWNDA